QKVTDCFRRIIPAEVFEIEKREITAGTAKGIVKAKIRGAQGARVLGDFNGWIKAALAAKSPRPFFGRFPEREQLILEKSREGRFVSGGASERGDAAVEIFKQRLDGKTRLGGRREIGCATTGRDSF